MENSRSAAAPAVADVLDRLPPGRIAMRGLLDRAIGLTIANRLKTVDYRHLVDPFRHRDERDGKWRCEFWGKVSRSTMLAYRYTQDPGLRRIIDATVDDLLSTQTPDGCISSYPYDLQYTNWDIWGRKYVLLGLLTYHQHVQPRPEVEKALRRMVDHLMTDVGPQARDILACGWWEGLAASSILEPIMLVHRLTGEARYLEFAKWIASRGGAKDRDVYAAARSGVAPKDNSSAKAYEMMSCFEGLAELHRVTGEPALRDSILGLYRAVRDREIMVTGVGGLKDMWGEFWYDGATNQCGHDVGSLGETCVTTTWIKLCEHVLRLTGDPTVVDEIERSLYNGIAGAMTPDGSWYMHCNPTPLAGTTHKVRAGDQIPGYGEDCCLANGPMGLVVAPLVAVMRHAEGPVVNLYETGEATVDLDAGVQAHVAISGDYPRSGAIAIAVKPSAPATFTVRLRIPAWSARTRVTVDGQAVEARPGTYCTVRRHWTGTEQIAVELDLRGRVMRSALRPDRYAVLRGPLVLAQDSRLGAVDVPIKLVPSNDGRIELSDMPARDGIAFTYALPGGDRLCDYTSAGNGFDPANTLCVWVPVQGVAAG